MSAEVEDRIVAMKFDNKQFEPAAKSTLGIIDRLKSALNFSNSSKGLNDLQNTANKFSLSGLANAATGISGKFLAMTTVALTALTNITNKAVDAGLRIGKALTLEPIQQGFEEYETGLNSVQTILANTQASGAKLKDVNATLKELNTYSDQTIYNFGEMAKNIGTFTAAGVDLKTSAASIKGIANLAALSGSNSQQASTAMYQLSQAISSGRVSLQDWNSVVNAGMGGTVFQRALAQTAEKMGTLDKGAVKLTGKMKNATINGQSFRESITAKPGEESWLTSEVLTNTLKQFTGDMSDAELAAQGFNASQIQAIKEQAKTAVDAATQVKTFTQLIGTMKESAGSGWAQTFQIMLGDFEEAKKLFTEVNNIAGEFITNSANARNKMLQDWKDLGGRTKAIEGLRNIFKAIVAVLVPIKEAFRDIFPATTGKQLFDMTVAFLEFTKHLKIGADTAINVRRIFRGVFSIFSIGWSVIKILAGAIGGLFKVLGSNSGGFLDMAADIGDWIVKLDLAIKKGDSLKVFFEQLSDVIRSPRKALTDLANSIENFFKNINIPSLGKLPDLFGRLRDRLEPLDALADNVSKSWSKLSDVFKSLAKYLEPVTDLIGDTLSGVGNAIAEAFEAGDFNSVYDAINTGLLTGIVLLIKKFFANGLKIDFGGGFVSGIKDTFGALTDTLKAMQTSIQAKTLLTIAAAVALLTVSIVALSLIDSAKLTKALAAMSVAFAQLLGAMAILTKIAGSAGIVKVPAIAAAMVLLAASILILSAAVTVLSKLSWEELGKGLTGVAALLAMLVGVSLGLDKTSGSMLRAGLAMIPLAVGIKILASAVQSFAEMSWGQMVKGLVGMAGALVVIAAAIALMPKSMILQAAGLVLVAIALNGIALAMKIMGGMSWGEIAKSLVLLTASLAILAGALYLMTAALPGAAALIVAAGALAILAPVLLLMGNMTWKAIAKGLVLLTGALAILAGGLYLMTAALPGAAALLVAAAALAILAPVLVTLGAMSWKMIAKGLVALAGAFAVLGLAGLVLTPVIPSILGLAAALLLLGVGITLVGVGALALATAFSIFAAAGAAGISALINMIKLIPLFLTEFAKGILGFVITLAEQGTKFTAAFASLIGSLLDALIMLIPKIGVLIGKLVDTMAVILIRDAPKFAAAGQAFLLAFLKIVANNIPKFVTAGTDIIVNFIKGLTKNLYRVQEAAVDFMIAFMDSLATQIPRLADGGAKAVIKLVNGIADAIRKNREAMNKAGRNLGSAILEGMVSGIRSGISWVVDWAKYMALSAYNAAKRALGINSPSKKFAFLGEGTNEGFALGVKRSTYLSEDAVEKVAGTTLDTMQTALKNLYDVMPDNINLDPTITPVLDLSKLTTDASKIDGMMGGAKLSADLSLNSARSLASSEQDRADIDSENAQYGDVTYLDYVQNINAPSAVPAAEVYLNTKGQLSMAKEGFNRR